MWTVTRRQREHQNIAGMSVLLPNLCHTRAALINAPNKENLVCVDSPLFGDPMPYLVHGELGVGPGSTLSQCLSLCDRALTQPHCLPHCHQGQHTRYAVGTPPRGGRHQVGVVVTVKKNSSERLYLLEDIDLKVHFAAVSVVTGGGRKSVSGGRKEGKKD